MICKIFGHNWIPIYIGDRNYNFVGTYCDRCRFGYEDLINYVKNHKVKYNTYAYKYWKGEEDKTKEKQND
jgi:hypothetical protein